MKELTRRTVKTIEETLEPKQVFDLITSREYEYPPTLLPEYAIHDRAGMSLAYLTIGRVTEIFGGLQYKRIYVCDLYKDGEDLPGVDLENYDKKRFEKARDNLHGASPYRLIDKRNWQEEVIGKHQGICRENITVNENFLEITTMPIVKRSSKIIAKYGQQVAQRSSLRLPLKRGIYNNPFFDQLVPFTWLVLEYLETCAPATGKLFHYQDARAWYIIGKITGRFPNWFRAQSDRFYKQCLYRGDPIGYAIFAGRVKADNTMSYQRFAWNADLKDPSIIMNFEWIDKTTEQIRERIHKAKGLNDSSSHP